MEGKSVYESSLEEIRKVQRSLATGGSISIDVNKLDSQTRGVVVQALANALSKRTKEVLNVISGNGGIY